MNKQSQLKIVALDGRIECYFPDGSIALSQNGTVTYYSTKGNKIRITKQTLKLSENVEQKIEQMCNCLTIFQDEYIVKIPVQPEEVPAKKAGSYFKKYKIQQFYWENAQIQQKQDGFCVLSDDCAVKVVLKKDLFNITVSYPQRTGYRRVNQEGQYLKTKNRRRQLIQKYGGKYIDYPQNMVQVQIEHEYIEVTKQFTMFGLPPRWCPPLRIIWSYLLVNKIIPHSFCYIDFQDPDNKHLKMITATKMPPVRPLLTTDQNVYMLSPEAIPIYGKPNHNYKWRWLYAKREDNVLSASFIEEGDCIIRQDYGFWFIEGNNVIYKRINKDEIDYKVTLSAFPLNIRFENQPVRDIKAHILAVKNYKEHRLYLESRESQTSALKNHRNEELIAQQQLPQVGIFKAYGNGVVIARFQDKTLMTVRNNEVTIIAPNGRSLLASLNGMAPRQFKDHLSYLADWYQRIYNPQGWQNKIMMNEALEQHLKSTSMFLNVAQYYKKR